MTQCFFPAQTFASIIYFMWCRLITTNAQGNHNEINQIILTKKKEATCSEPSIVLEYYKFSTLLESVWSNQWVNGTTRTC